MPVFNKLIDAISRNPAWLLKSLKDLDPFTSRLVQIAQICEKPRQELALGVLRSDYLYDEKAEALQQVEINTISVAFPALATKLEQFHRFVLSISRGKIGDLEEGLPRNEALAGVVDAIAKAQELEGSKGLILMVISPNERNCFDQLALELDLWARYGLRTMRATFKDLHSGLILDTFTGKISYNSLPISVVYYRTGYAPCDYSGEGDWAVKLKIEQSSAVKCPNIGYHLAGVKKVQQLLCLPEHLARFEPDEQRQAQLRSSFTTLLCLRSQLTPSLLSEVQSNPNDWVLKPMREGGGNNIYCDELAKAFKAYAANPCSAAWLQGCVLMKRIKPVSHRVLMAREGEVREVMGLWELGIYGTYIGDGNKEYWNKTQGHLLRTKGEDSNEGGVAAGFAVLDSPYLV
jgi:glutathione synthase